MHRNKQIAIILPDTLQCIGLQCILADYFPPVTVSLFPSFEAFIPACNEAFDYYFTSSEIMVLNTDFFLPRRSKTMILIGGPEGTGGLSTMNHITRQAPQEIIIEQIQQLLTGEGNNNQAGETNKELSARETDVLQLIVKGITNKEIADKLNISLNTVLTHRKNITAKLGIKTVSGLTFYAIMNGIISGDDIEL